jgi:hypothetical protein
MPADISWSAHGRAFARGIHAIQLEIDRGLYLDDACSMRSGAGLCAHSRALVQRNGWRALADEALGSTAAHRRRIKKPPRAVRHESGQGSGRRHTRRCADVALAKGGTRHRTNSKIGWPRSAFKPLISIKRP